MLLDTKHRFDMGLRRNGRPIERSAITPDSPSAPKKKTYRAGDTITTKLTLKPGHDVPASTSATFTLTPPPTIWDPNRPSSFGVWGAMTVTAMQPAPPAPPPNVITLTGVIPHHIIGGTYKPTQVAFSLPNEPSQFDNNPDPDGDLVLQVEDAKPTPVSTPVIQDFDLA